MFGAGRAARLAPWHRPRWRAPPLLTPPPAGPCRRCGPGVRGGQPPRLHLRHRLRQTAQVGSCTSRVHALRSCRPPGTPVPCRRGSRRRSTPPSSTSRTCWWSTEAPRPATSWCRAVRAPCAPSTGRAAPSAGVHGGHGVAAGRASARIPLLAASADGWCSSRPPALRGAGLTPQRRQAASPSSPTAARSPAWTPPGRLQYPCWRPDAVRVPSALPRALPASAAPSLAHLEGIAPSVGVGPAPAGVRRSPLRSSALVRHDRRRHADHVITVTGPAPCVAWDGHRGQGTPTPAPRAAVQVTPVYPGRAVSGRRSWCAPDHIVAKGRWWCAGTGGAAASIRAPCSSKRRACPARQRPSTCRFSAVRCWFTFSHARAPSAA